MADSVSFVIRRAQQLDSTSIAHLAGQLGYAVNQIDVTSRLPALQEPSDVVLVVELNSNKAVIGWAHVRQVPSSLLSEQAAELIALVVDEKYRGRGIGQSLLEACELWAQRNSFKSLRLRSNIKRLEAHRFYERAGYKLTKTQCNFMKAFS